MNSNFTFTVQNCHLVIIICAFDGALSDWLARFRPYA